MRLIDKNAVEKMLWRRLYKDKNAYNNCKNGLDKIQTAYDVDNIVKELEELKAYALYENFNAETKWIDKAIEIVKAGGKNE